MSNFLKLTKRLNSNNFAVVTGSDFRNGSLPYAYLGRGEEGKTLGIFTKYSKDKLLIYGEHLEDFVFGKEDILYATVLQQECNFKMGGNQQKIGPKYEVKFKNGKTALIAIPATAAYIIEQIIFWLRPYKDYSISIDINCYRYIKKDYAFQSHNLFLY